MSISTANAAKTCNAVFDEVEKAYIKTVEYAMYGDVKYPYSSYSAYKIQVPSKHLPNGIYFTAENVYVRRYGFGVALVTSPEADLTSPEELMLAAKYQPDWGLHNVELFIVACILPNGQLYCTMFSDKPEYGTTEYKGTVKSISGAVADTARHATEIQKLVIKKVQEGNKFSWEYSLPGNSVDGTSWSGSSGSAKDGSVPSVENVSEPMVKGFVSDQRDAHKE